MIQVNKWLNKQHYSFDDLLQIMKLLRGENGCPWDREQTHTSIRNNLLEEAYETADAIDRLNDKDMTEELGDLLMQIVFHSQIAEERGAFSIDDVTDTVCKKLIYRHPHVFGDVNVSDSNDVLENWDKLKNKEKNMQSYSQTLDAVPKAFPSCMRAQKIQKRATKAGYDFESAEAAIEKVEEELFELKNAIKGNSPEHSKDELGDLLFSVINVARFLDCDAEEQLNTATEKFVSRFKKAEVLANQEGMRLDLLSADELDTFWVKAKLLELK